MKRNKGLRKERYRLAGRLNRENKKVYDEIYYYMHLGDMVDSNKEEIAYNIAEKIYKGQEIGQNYKESIGEDYIGYCDEILESREKVKLKDKLKVFTKIESYILVAALVLNILFQKINLLELFTTEIRISSFILVGIILGTVNYIIKIFVIKEGSKKNKIIDDMADGLLIGLLAGSAATDSSIYINSKIYLLLFFITIGVALINFKNRK